MIPKATVIRLDRKTRSELEGWLRASTTEQRMVRRARIVLLAADGWASRAIAREVGVMTGVVSVWRTRFAASGIDGLKDKPRPGAKAIYTAATGKRILAVLDRPVPKGRARWTCELVAEALGDVDVNYVRRFLRKQKIDLAGRKSWCESVMSKTCLRHGIPSSPPRLPMWSVSIWRRPGMRSSSVWTRSRRSRRSNVLKAI
jgi:transposase